ncbi:hypothetical protein JCGZ_14658 [Jatropha curcas]|uniref:Nucleotide-diphospho-sugar transferase domain-containing protein n=1 Tax=Jatropha curcas TaxID=180498 RepID=A0A067JYC6_JATCU|nr:uncharacterized protein At1g28695 [Jatropha curcas]KDP28887.1 hypothetical protein JCGZ_14658 [Jatropha curcas]
MDSSSRNTSSYVVNLVFLSLIIAAFVYLYISSPSVSNPLLSYRHDNSCRHSQSVTFSLDELEMALQKASMPNKTVIIAVLNKAYVEPSVKSETTMLDLFLESFWYGEDTRSLLDHLLVVAVDQTAYDRCKFKRLNCYKLETQGVDFTGEKLFMSQDFIKMMWRRTLLLLDVLKHGYNFIFTDSDVMWLRNPFPKLSNNQSIDLQISTDWFNGDPLSERNFINTGFYYVRSNNKTIALFDAWYSRKDNSTGKKEQDVLLDLVREGALRKLGINARFLDTVFFSGFCADSKDITAVSTVHANCCRSISAKVLDLRSVLRDWMRFKADQSRIKKNHNDTNPTLSFRWSGHFGCWRSWNNTSV